MIGARWEAVTKLLPEKGVVIITDKNVFRLYGKNFPKFPVIRIVPGEESKKLKVVESLAGKLLKMGIDRSGFILAIGGVLYAMSQVSWHRYICGALGAVMSQPRSCHKLMPAPEVKPGSTWV